MRRKTGQTLIAFVTYCVLLGQQCFCISQPTVAYPILNTPHPYHSHLKYQQEETTVQRYSFL